MIKVPGRWRWTLEARKMEGAFGISIHYEWTVGTPHKGLTISFGPFVIELHKWFEVDV